MAEENKRSDVVTELVKWYIVNERVPLIGGRENPLNPVETDLLELGGHLSFELGRIGGQCRDVLRRLDFSDIVLLLGAGGAIYYFWRNLFAPTNPANTTHGSRFGETSHFSWLLDKQTAVGGRQKVRKRNFYQGTTAASDNYHCCGEKNLQLDCTSGLNSFSA